MALTKQEEAAAPLPPSDLILRKGRSGGIVSKGGSTAGRGQATSGGRQAGVGRGARGRGYDLDRHFGTGPACFRDVTVGFFPTIRGRAGWRRGVDHLRSALALLRPRRIPLALAVPLTTMHWAVTSQDTASESSMQQISSMRCDILSSASSSCERARLSS